MDKGPNRFSFNENYLQEYLEMTSAMLKMVHALRAKNISVHDRIKSMERFKTQKHALELDDGRIVMIDVRTTEGKSDTQSFVCPDAGSLSVESEMSVF